MDNLRSKTIEGVFWNVAERVGVRVIAFLPSIFLARLLSPAEFGLIGMLTIFIMLTQLFLDSGFGAALIQKKDADYVDENSIFYFNILVGGLAVVVLFFIAPLIAAFYNQPILSRLMRWLSLDILISAFGLIQTTNLMRSMNYKALMKVNMLATLAGGVVGIGAAYWGLGVWSLVLQTMSNTVIEISMLWFMSDWRPAWVFSLQSLRSMYGFGSRMLSAKLITTIFDNIYQVLIGKLFSAAVLGYYTRASSLRMVFITTSTDSISKVLFSSTASIQDDPARLKRAYGKAIQLVSFVHFPLMLGLIVVAAPLINLVFSAKWAQAIGYFQLMCIAGILYPHSMVNLEILKVKGRSDLFLRLDLIKRVLLLLTIFITYRWGITAMLIGQVVNAPLAYYLNAFFSKQLIDYSVWEQLRDSLSNFLIALLMALSMWAVGLFVPGGDLGRLLVQGAFGLLFYFSVNYILKTDALNEFFRVGKNLFHALSAKGSL